MACGYACDSKHKTELCVVVLIIIFSFIILIGGGLCAIFLPGSRTSQTKQWSTTIHANPMHTNSIDSNDLFSSATIPSPTEFTENINPENLIIDSYWRVYVRNATSQLTVYDNFSNQLWHKHNFPSNMVMSGDNKNLYGFEKSNIEIQQYSTESGKLRNSFDGSDFVQMTEIVASHSHFLYTVLKTNENTIFFTCLNTDLSVNWNVQILDITDCSNCTIVLSTDQTMAIVGGSTSIYKIDLSSKQITTTLTTCNIFECNNNNNFPQITVINDNNILIMLNNKISLIDINSFTKLWMQNVTTQYNNNNSVIIMNAAVSLSDSSIFTLLVATVDNLMECELQGIDTNTGNNIWRFSMPSQNLLNGPLSSPSIIGNSIYICSDNQIFRVDSTTGLVKAQNTVNYVNFDSFLPCAIFDERGVIYIPTENGVNSISNDDILKIPKIKWDITTYLILTLIILMLWWFICSLIGMFCFRYQPLGLTFASFISSNELVELILNIIAQKSVTRKICGCIKFHFKFKGRIYFIFLFAFSKLVNLLIVIILQVRTSLILTQ